jgi:DNA-directed RNA polymerase sigma subunit (sigma70/sigma32)
VFQFFHRTTAAPVPSLNSAIRRVLDLLYTGIPLPEKPVTEKHVSLDERNRLICTRYAADETLEEIARDLGLSHQRAHQIIHRWC